ncbi:MAG: tRNA (guanosine(37)-N1)-methyltransferase TrmD [Bryobacterales bacterium]|nr:tRNA (guanosine(37)-N1)-methyltransferase TrmD [Bryobacterales bacterium]
MIFHVLTIFPDFFRGPLDHGVVARAIEAGLLEVRCHNLRNWTYDRHRSVDDRPFGGGEGMVLKPRPVFEAVESVLPGRDQQRHRVVLLSAQGRPFHQTAARRLCRYQELVLICGRYEGVDERVAGHLADEELSIGDYVLSGGELAAAVVIDSISRLIPGVLGNEASTLAESFSEDSLDCPHYTRPAEFRGWKIPPALAGGDHRAIREWRRMAAREKTARLRPELLAIEETGNEQRVIDEGGRTE